MIVTYTLYDSSHEEMLPDALKSVIPWADRCLLIDTSSEDNGFDLRSRVQREARALVQDRLILSVIPWKGSAALARNEALEECAKAGGTYAVTLDADERLHVDVDEIRNLEKDGNAGVVLVPHDSGSYCKERVFRLSDRGLWAGKVHEYYKAPLGTPIGRFEFSTFSELEKTASDQRSKFERVADVLEKEVLRNPTDSRSWYYLGDAYAILTDLSEEKRGYEAALRAFDCCARLEGWREESSWACYRAAAICCKIHRFKEAIAACSRGLTLCPETPELAWLAGYACYQAGLASSDQAFAAPEFYKQAIAWSNMAVAIGPLGYSNLPSSRTGFQFPVGQYEGPFDTLRFAFQKIGDPASERQAHVHWEAAKNARETQIQRRRPSSSPSAPIGDPLRSS